MYYDDRDNQQEQNSQDNNTEKQGEEQKKLILKTRMGIPEEVYVRPSKIGRFNANIHEFDDLIIEGKISLNESRVFTYIKKKTIYFRETELRAKRKDLEIALNIAKPKLAKAIQSLVEQAYILEMPDKDHYYFYSINPYKFDGLIVMRTKEESAYRLNRRLKPVTFLDSFRKGRNQKGDTKKVLAWYQKVIAEVPKGYLGNELNARNYSHFELVKYILSKYILSNGFSEARAERVLGIVSKIENPEFAIKQFVALMQRDPSYGRAMLDQLVVSDSQKTDAFSNPLRTNAFLYLVSCWEQLKPHLQNVPHPDLDRSEQAEVLRKQLADLIADYPIEFNRGKVFDFPKKENA